MDDEELVEFLDWISCRFNPAGYEWIDTENDKCLTSEDLLRLYYELPEN